MIETKNEPIINPDDIQVNATKLDSNETMNIEIPNSATFKNCVRCNGKRYKNCFSCFRRGKVIFN